MTARCFVAGDPVAHSRSPLIHGHWIARLGLDATYGKEHCPVEALPALMARVRSGELRGGNLTVPLKEAALPLLDRLTDEAATMGRSTPSSCATASSGATTPTCAAISRRSTRPRPAGTPNRSPS